MHFILNFKLVNTNKYVKTLLYKAKLESFSIWKFYSFLSRIEINQEIIFELFEPWIILPLGNTSQFVGATERILSLFSNLNGDNWSSWPRIHQMQNPVTTEEKFDEDVNNVKKFLIQARTSQE
jgi:hypothetical protein